MDDLSIVARVEVEESQIKKEILNKTSKIKAEISVSPKLSKEWDKLFSAASQKANGFNKEISESLRLYERLSKSISGKLFTLDNVSQNANGYNGTNQYIQSTFEKIQKLATEYRKLQSELKDAPFSFDTYKSIIQQLSKLNEEYSKVSVGNKRFLTTLSNSTSLDVFSTKIETAKNRLVAFGKQNSALFKDKTLSKAYQDLENFKISDPAQLTLWNAKFAEFSSAVKAAQRNTKTFSEVFSDNLKKFSSWLSIGSIVVYGRQALWDMFENIKALDTAMVELRKVSTATDAELQQFFEHASDKAVEIGSTITNLINATSDFSRLGYNLQDSQMLGETATIYANVGDDIENIEQATDSIISTMKAFNIEAENSMTIVDKLNEVGNTASISSGDLGEALKRSASAMAEANNSLDETIGLIVAGNEVVRDAESVGTGLKTVSLRIRGATADLKNMGEEIDALASSTPKLRKEIKGLTGVDIMLDDNTFKSTYQILKEISAVWDDLTDVSRAAVLEDLFGKRQANIGASIIENFSSAEQAMASSINSSNSAMKEYNTWLTSIEAKQQQFMAQFEAFSSAAINSEFVKGAVDTGTGILGVLTAVVEQLGLIPTLAAAASAALSLKSNKGILQFAGNKLSGTTTESQVKPFANAAEVIKKYNTAVNSASLSNQKFEEIIQQSDASLSTYLKGLNGAPASHKAYTASLNSAKSATIGMTAAQTALKVAAAAANAALTMGLSFVVSKLFEGISTAIDNAIHASEKAVEAAQELRSEYESTFSTISSNISSLQSVEEEFSKLSKGVGEHGENISLSADEYERYRDIVSEVLEYVPELTARYDEQGIAIADNNNLIEKAIGLLEEKRKLELLEMTSSENMWTLAQESIEAYKSDLEKINSVTLPTELDFSGVKINEDGSKTGGFVSVLDKYIEEVIGVEKRMDQSLNQYIFENYEAIYDNFDAIMKQAEMGVDGWAGLTEENLYNFQEYLNQMRVYIADYENDMKSFNPTLKMVAETSDSWDTLTDAQQSFVSSYVDGFNITSDTTKQDIGDMKKDVLSLVDTIGKNGNIGEKIDKFFSLDKSKLSASEYSKELENFINSVSDQLGLSEDQKAQLKVSLEIDPTEYSKVVKEAQNKLDGEFVSVSVKEISSLTESLDKYKEVVSEINSGNLSSDSILSIIEEMPELAKYIDGTSESLAELKSALVELGSENINDQIKSLKDAIKETSDPETQAGLEALVKLLYNLKDDFENGIVNDSVIQSTDTLTKGIESLYTAAKNFDTYGGFSSTDIQNILEVDPSLSSDIQKFLNNAMSADELMQKLNSSAQNLVKEYYASMGALGGNVDEIWNEVIQSNSSAINSLKNLYGLDIQNYSTYQQSKSAIKGTFNNSEWIMESAKVSDFINLYLSDFTNFQQFETAKAQITAGVLQQIVGMNAQQILSLAQAYGVDLSNFTNVENEKPAVASVIANKLIQIFGVVSDSQRRSLQNTLNTLKSERDAIYSSMATATSSADIVAAQNMLGSLNKRIQETESLLNSSGSFDTNSFLAQVNNIASSINAQLPVMNGLLDDAKNSANQASKAADQALQKLQDLNSELQDQVSVLNDDRNAIEELLSMVISMLKEKYSDQIDDIDAVIDKLEEQHEAEIEQLEAETDAYNDKIDAQIELLRLKEEERKFEEELADKTKSLSDLKSEMYALELDDSDEGQKRRLELQEELKEKEKELAEFQRDYKLDLQEDSLNKEKELFQQAQKEKEQLLIKEYEERKALLEKQKEDIQNYANDEWNIRQEAFNLINQGGQKLYNDLIEYNKHYGNAINADVKQKWDAAYTALNKYNSGQINVKNTLETIASRTTKLKSEIDKLAPAIGNAQKAANNLKTAVSNVSNYTKSASSYANTLKNNLTTAYNTLNKINQNQNKYPDGQLGTSQWHPSARPATENRQYATGRKSGPRELAITQENGNEIITRLSKNGKFTLLEDGDGVLPHNITETLWKLGTNPSAYITEQMKNSVSPASISVSNLPAITVRQGDIIIQGNADRKSVKEIMNIIRQNSRELTEIVYSTTERISRNQGYKPNVKDMA